MSSKQCSRTILRYIQDGEYQNINTL